MVLVLYKYFLDKNNRVSNPSFSPNLKHLILSIIYTFYRCKKKLIVDL